MEYLKRKVKSDREDNQDNMTVSVIDDVRLTLRWADKEKPEKDVVMNFTREETSKIKNIFIRRLLG